MSGDVVEVLDVTFILAVPGKDGEPAKLHYTVREHLGDVLKPEPGMTTIMFAPKDVLVGIETKRIAGKRVTLSSAQIIGVEREARFEPRVRPSAKALVSRHQAELEEVRTRLGVEKAN